MKNILLTKEVADMLRVSEEYVRELIRKKKMGAYSEGRRGGFRIPLSEVEKYVESKRRLFMKGAEK